MHCAGINCIVEWLYMAMEPSVRVIQIPPYPYRIIASCQSRSVLYSLFCYSQQGRKCRRHCPCIYGQTLRYRFSANIDKAALT
jgi:hypothetical protein